MPDLSLDDRKVGYLLGLGDLQRPPICHGYANGDRCPECLEREEREERVAELTANPIRQPWELEAA